jgi:serine/threonine protein phosphatase 1
MTQRRIVIGDVHGYYDSLMTLLETIAPNREDQVYFLGDLIDRGSQSSQVVNFVKHSGYHCVLGNHEQMLLDILFNNDRYPSAREAWLFSGGENTLKSYGERGVDEEHLYWMQHLPNYIDLGDILLVHAGVHPTIPFQKQTSDHFCWIRQEFHSNPYAYFSDKLIITGHTITFTLPGVAPGQIARGAGWLDIDTGAYHPRSGWLTALDVTNWQVYQVNVWTQATRQLPLGEVVANVNYGRKKNYPPRKKLAVETALRGENQDSLIDHLSVESSYS